MKITKHGQSCFLIETNKGSRVLIDPGKYVFSEKEGLGNSAFTEIDVIIITHEHSDHFNEDTLEIIERENPLVFTTPAVAEIIKEKINVKSEILDFESRFGPTGKGLDVYIYGVPSEHGPLPNGKPAPEVRGAVIEADGIKFYTPGDTIKIKDVEADVIAVPIAGTVTTTVDEAIEQISNFASKPKLLIPMHFDNSDYPDDSEIFVPVAEKAGLEAELLGFGESIEIE